MTKSADSNYSLAGHCVYIEHAQRMLVASDHRQGSYLTSAVQCAFVDGALIAVHLQLALDDISRVDSEPIDGSSPRPSQHELASAKLRTASTLQP